jgi:hypothetical protein
MKYEVDHARHDRAHCLAPLFRSLKRGKRGKLDVTYTFGDESIRFVGFEELGADDMRFLQGIVALAGPNGVLLTPEPKTEAGRQLRLFLEPRFEAIEHDALVVRESMSKLLYEVGMTDGGENIKALKASLLRMSNVTILVTKGQKQASFHLLSYAFDESDGRLWVALNPRIADAILGHRPHARIDMGEVRALQTDPARLIHQRLCGWIDPGKSGYVELDTLLSYVWPDPSSNPNTLKTRRQTVRRALAELIGIGWKVNEYVRDKWQIFRPPRQRRSSRSNATQIP